MLGWTMDRPPVERMSRAAKTKCDTEPTYWRLLKGGSSRVASDRLTASVENFENELDHRIARDGSLAEDDPAVKAIRAQLELVRQHQRCGEIDAAWRCFHPAVRQEIYLADPVELQLRADALRREAGAQKLSDWRSKAILDLLGTAETEGRLPGLIEDVRTRVVEATRLREDDDNNRYYKVALVRGQRTLLVLVLIVCLAFVLGLALAVDWHTDLGDPSIGFLGLVALFGAIGACLSAIQSLGRTGAHARIPEHVASSLITITRPALGAAAALGLYAIAASGALNVDLTDEQAHLTVLALAFGSGFSERLVVSAVGAASGGAGDSKT
jgi:hypothetical protein